MNMTDHTPWHGAVDYVARVADSKKDDAIFALVWKRVQRGDRTNDLLQTIQALEAMDIEIASTSPEWGAALKWLAYHRAQGSNLMLDMLNAQVEAGNRSPELLSMIAVQQAAHTPLAIP